MPATWKPFGASLKGIERYRLRRAASRRNVRRDILRRGRPALGMSPILNLILLRGQGGASILINLMPIL